jgi:hypothetical protein
VPHISALPTARTGVIAAVASSVNTVLSIAVVPAEEEPVVDPPAQYPAVPDFAAAPPPHLADESVGVIAAFASDANANLLITSVFAYP